VKSTLRLFRILGFFTVLAFALLLFFNGYMSLLLMPVLGALKNGKLNKLIPFLVLKILNELK
jgi:PPP family 3-phenylpropionic acid transporter